MFRFTIYSTNESGSGYLVNRYGFTYIVNVDLTSDTITITDA